MLMSLYGCSAAAAALYPTDPFTGSELQNPSHDVLEIHIVRRSPVREALKLRKGRSGIHIGRRMLLPGEPFPNFRSSKSTNLM